MRKEYKYELGVKGHFQIAGVPSLI